MQHYLVPLQKVESYETATDGRAVADAYRLRPVKHKWIIKHTRLQIIAEYRYNAWHVFVFLPIRRPVLVIIMPSTILDNGVVKQPYQSSKNTCIDRQSASTPDAPTVYELNNIWIYNPNEQTISSGPDTPTVKLRAKTAEVLLLLIQNNQKLVTSRQFFDNVWEGKYVSENVLKQSIKELRDCFDDHKKYLILTVPKQGYRLAATIKTLPLTTNQSSTDALEKQIPGQKIDSNSQSKAILSKIPPRPNEPLSKDIQTNARNSDINAAINTGTNIASTSNDRVAYETLISPANKSILTTPLTRPAKSRFNLIRYRVWLYFGISIIAFLFLAMWYAYYQLQITNDTQKRKLAQMETSKRFSHEILFRYYNTPDRKQDLLKSVLDKSTIQLDSIVDSPATELGMLNALFELYHIGGYYNEARLIIGRMENKVADLYGKKSPEYIQVKFDTVDILLKLRRRQEAFDIANATLEQAADIHRDDKLIVAKAYFMAARAHLFCVAPFCDRIVSLTVGEKYTRQALQIYREELGEQALEVADTLWLLNWFVWDGAEKVRLGETAANLYMTQLGLYHEKTAAALEELSRTLVFWNLDWQQGEQYLLKAFNIRQRLYPENHPKMSSIHSYLGEHFFITGHFERAIHHLARASKIITYSLGEGNDLHLQNLMLQARSQLYRGKPAEAKKAIDTAFEIIERHKMIPAMVVYRALLTTRFRTHIALGQPASSYEDIIAEVTSIDEQFKNPKSVLAHEYFTLILKYHPEKTDDQYIENVKQLVESLAPQNRYLYLTDLAFLKQRAVQLCTNISQSFCQQVQALFDTVTTTPESAS